MKNNPFSTTSFFLSVILSAHQKYFYLEGKQEVWEGSQIKQQEEDTEILQTKENMFNDIRNGPNMPLPQTR
jgi:hypothetical protein